MKEFQRLQRNCQYIDGRRRIQGGGLARTERDFQYIKERRHSSIGSSTGISFENVLLKYKNTFFLTSNKLKKYEY